MESLYCSNDSIQLSKMAMHQTAILEFFKKFLLQNPMPSWSETRQTWMLRINKISGWQRTKQQSWYLSNNILPQTICPHEQKLDWMLQAKKRLINANFISLQYKRWSCTKQPSWNFSNNFFQPICSLEQKLMGMHHATWSLRLNNIIPFRYQN